VCTCVQLVFFFSSRRRHTRFSRDWSSDVCSSDLRASAQHEIAMLERRWLQFWNASARAARINELRDAIREIDQMIRQLEEGWAGDLEDRIEELLGVTTRGLQSAVAGAFSAATAEDFARSIENSLTSRIRNAWVTAFLESATMSPLFEQLGDMIRE